VAFVHAISANPTTSMWRQLDCSRAQAVAARALICSCCDRGQIYCTTGQQASLVPQHRNYDS